MKLVYGEEAVTRDIVRPKDADNVWGSYWHAWRTESGFALEYMTGDTAGRDRRFDLSEEEFERLRADPEQFRPIIRAHGG